MSWPVHIVRVDYVTAVETALERLTSGSDTSVPWLDCGEYPCVAVVTSDQLDTDALSADAGLPVSRWSGTFHHLRGTHTVVMFASNDELSQWPRRVRFRDREALELGAP